MCGKANDNFDKTNPRINRAEGADNTSNRQSDSKGDNSVTDTKESTALIIKKATLRSMAKALLKQEMIDTKRYGLIIAEIDKLTE